MAISFLHPVEPECPAMAPYQLHYYTTFPDPVGGFMATPQPALGWVILIRVETTTGAGFLHFSVL